MVAGAGPANTTAGLAFSGVVAAVMKALDGRGSAAGALAVVAPMTGALVSDEPDMNALAAATLAVVVTTAVVLAVVVLEGVFGLAAFLAAFCATASRTLSASTKRPDASSSFFAVIAHGAPPGPTAT
jgi:hypothetical protein